VHRLLNPLGFVAFKMGRLRGGPSRTGVRRSIPHHFTLLQIWLFPAGIKMVRDVTDEQRSSPPIFNATPWATASWLFFCVARSTVMIQVAALRSRLEKQPTDLRRNPSHPRPRPRDGPAETQLDGIFGGLVWASHQSSFRSTYPRLDHAPDQIGKKEEITRKDNGVASDTWYIVPTFSRNGFVRFPLPYDANFPRRRPAQGFAQW
jgi:hypothetical protein